jgi:hypothetical protein
MWYPKNPWPLEVLSGHYVDFNTLQFGCCGISDVMAFINCIGLTESLIDNNLCIEIDIESRWSHRNISR